MLSGDVKNIQGTYEGLYNYNGTFNERDYWVKVGGGHVLWYYPQRNGWTIGIEEKKGSPGWIYGRSDSTCPNNSKNDWNYYDNGWISTNDVLLNCIGNHIKLLELIGMYVIFFMHLGLFSQMVSSKLEA